MTAGHRMALGPGMLWNIAILASAAVTLLVVFAGLLNGISDVLPHLLYIPVVLAAYRYPKYGLLFAGGIAGIYLIMVVLSAGFVTPVLPMATIRAVVIVAIGGLVSYLTRRLQESETLYQGLFDHSEAGSLLVRSHDGKRTLEAANDKAGQLLGIAPAELQHTGLTSFWTKEDQETVFSRIAAPGSVYTGETVFTSADGDPVHVLVSVASLPDRRTIITFVDITRRVAAETALKSANDKLNLLSNISTNHLHQTIDEMLEVIEYTGDKCRNSEVFNYIDRIRTLAWMLVRQIFLSESYRDLGRLPPTWQSVQDVLRSVDLTPGKGRIDVRFWAERLVVYADPLFQGVLPHIVGNALTHGEGATNLVITYHDLGKSLELVVHDDGPGIPVDKKQQIFEYDAGGTAGIGLFVCRQIVEVTGMAIAETGGPGEGARFVITVPKEMFRIEGAGEEAPPLPPVEGLWATGPEPVGVRELRSTEFHFAERLWTDYQQTKGNPVTDRIFAAFAGGYPVSVARCRHHPDGFEVDAVFTPPEHRGHGYAYAVVRGLVEACGSDTLYMHSVLGLSGFYGRFGFVPIDENGLPPTIKERYAWAQGNMEGANVCPMKREGTQA